MAAVRLSSRLSGHLRSRRWRLAGLILALGLVLALAAAWSALTPQVRASFQLRPGFLALAFLIQTPGWLLAVDAWRRMLRATQPAGAPAGPGDPLRGMRFAEHLQGHTLAALAQVLPGSIWAPLTRVAYYRERGLGTLRTGAAMLLEMTLLGLAGLLVFLLALPFAVGVPPAALPWLLAAGGASLAALHPRVFGRLLALLARGLRIQPVPAAPRLGLLARLLGQELLVMGLSGLALILVIRSLLPSAAHPATVLAAWGLGVAIASLLAWLPATALLKDGGMIALLAPLCLAAADGQALPAAALALGLTLAWRLWTLLVLLVWAGGATVAVRRGGRGVRPMTALRSVDDGVGAHDRA
ncbi:MAG: hypothetical protein ACH37Z_02860 [Anaerolineae bacterium]|mgnify:FL=1|nr:hypothetical protein [Ardenticatenia bacterium]MBK8540468.1 hypothetical protein [Ardenticatenia bacterium]HQZ70719.1 hypothetical protein [Anaerolineae bacterium]HRA19128.1 hypothetical protein [Anaerolineae bacterium]